MSTALALILSLLISKPTDSPKPFIHILKGESSFALVSEGENFELQVTLVNDGRLESSGSESVAIGLLKGVRTLQKLEQSLPVLKPGERTTLRWKMKALKVEYPNSLIVKLNSGEPDVMAVVIPISPVIPVIQDIGLSAKTSSKYAFIQNENIRLLFQNSSQGLSLRLMSKNGPGWKQVAVSSPFMLLEGNGGGAAAKIFPFHLHTGTAQITSSYVTLSLPGDSSELWTSTIQCTLTANSNFATVYTKVTPKFDVRIKQICFPDLAVGGSETKISSILPGAKVVLPNKRSQNDKIEERTQSAPYGAIRIASTLVMLSWDPNLKYKARLMYNSADGKENINYHTMKLVMSDLESWSQASSLQNIVLQGDPVSMEAEIGISPKSNSIFQAVEIWLKNHSLASTPQPVHLGTAAIDWTLSSLIDLSLQSDDAILAMWKNAWITQDDKLRSKLVELVRESSKLRGSRTTDLALHGNDAEGYLRHLRSSFATRLDTINQTETWGDASARNAAKTAHYALLSRDEQAIQACFKNAEYLDKYPMPVSLNKSADEVNFWLDLGVMEKNQKYLQKAKSRALAGLTLVPLAKMTPEMQPFFTQNIEGAMAFAQALIRLSVKDRSLPWKEIAQSMTNAAVIQAEAVVSNSPSTLTSIATTEEMLSGNSPFAQTVVTRLGSTFCSISSVGEMTDFVTLPKSLNFNDRYYPLAADCVVVAGVDEPVTVTVDEQTLGQSNELNGVSSGWKYLRNSRQLIIKINHTEKAAHVKINF